MDKSKLKNLCWTLIGALLIWVASMSWNWIENKNTEHRKILWNINILRLKNDMSLLEELDK